VRESHKGGERLGETFFINPNRAQMYMMSLYWSLYTLLGIGYGDMSAQNMTELFYMLVMMVMGGFTWACVIANIVTIAQSLDDAEEAHFKKFDQSRDFINVHSEILGMEINQRILKYFHHRKFVSSSTAENEVVKLLSPELQLIMTESVHNFWVDKTWLRYFSGPALVAICSCLAVVLHPPGELTVDAQVFSVAMKGMAFWKAHLIRRGDSWGHDFILHNHLLRECPQALALSYFCAGVLSYRSLMEVLQNYPDEYEVLSEMHIRLTMKRGLVCIVDALKRRISKENWDTAQRAYTEEKGGTSKLIKQMVNAATENETYSAEDPRNKFLESFLETNGLKQWTPEELAAMEEARRNPETLEGYVTSLDRELLELTEANATRETETDALLSTINEKIEGLRMHIASAASDHA
jgi:hypothetical protein